MKTSVPRRRPAPADPRRTDPRRALLRRVKGFYDRFNEADWDGCYTYIDPTLRADSRPDFTIYARQLAAFKDAYGMVRIRPGYAKIAHLQTVASAKQSDKRPFAYVHLFWQDASNRFHVFQERWIEDRGRWYTRVVGLLPNPNRPDRD